MHSYRSVRGWRWTPFASQTPPLPLDWSANPTPGTQIDRPLIPVIFLSPLSAAEDAFPLKARRILFLGDSITHAGEFVNMIEMQLRLQSVDPMPELVNAGLPSETCSGLSEPDHPFPRPDVHERLDRALAAVKPVVVVACYGMNDEWLSTSTLRSQPFGNSSEKKIQPLLWHPTDQKNAVLHNAWLSHIGHKRPGMANGLSLEEANAKVWIDVFLDRGDYIVEFSSPGRVDAASVLFQLNAAIQSIPMGPQLRDTSREPVKSAKASPLLPLANHWVPSVIVPSVAQGIYPVHAPLNSAYGTTGGYPKTVRSRNSGYPARDKETDFDAKRGGGLESLGFVLPQRQSILPKRKLKNTASASRSTTSDNPPLKRDHTPAIEAALSQEPSASKMNIEDQVQTVEEHPPDKDERRSLEDSSTTTDVYFRNFSSDHFDLQSLPAHLVAAIVVSGARLIKDPRRSRVS